MIRTLLEDNEYFLAYEETDPSFQHDGATETLLLSVNHAGLGLYDDEKVAAWMKLGGIPHDASYKTVFKDALIKELETKWHVCPNTPHHEIADFGLVDSKYSVTELSDGSLKLDITGFVPHFTKKLGELLYKNWDEKGRQGPRPVVKCLINKTTRGMADCNRIGKNDPESGLPWYRKFGHGTYRTGSLGESECAKSLLIFKNYREGEIKHSAGGQIIEWHSMSPVEFREGQPPIDRENCIMHTDRTVAGTLAAMLNERLDKCRHIFGHASLNITNTSDQAPVLPRRFGANNVFDGPNLLHVNAMAVGRFLGEFCYTDLSTPYLQHHMGAIAAEATAEAIINGLLKKPVIKLSQNYAVYAANKIKSIVRALPERLIYYPFGRTPAFEEVRL